MGNFLRIAKWGNPGTPGHPNQRWRQENLVTVEFPFIMRNAYAPGTVRRCLFHRKGAMRLKQALDNIKTAAVQEVKESPEWATMRLQVKRKYGFDHPSAFYDEKMADFVEGAAMELIAGCGGDIWGGSEVLRYVRGYEKQKILSPHAFAAAVDMNPAKNKQGSSSTTFPDWYIAAWQTAGFTWGGRFSGKRIDPMHFEL